MIEYWVAWGMSIGAVLYTFIAHNRINRLEDDIRELKRVRELSALQEDRDE